MYTHKCTLKKGGKEHLVILQSARIMYQVMQGTRLRHWHVSIEVVKSHKNCKTTLISRCKVKWFVELKPNTKI